MSDAFPRWPLWVSGLVAAVSGGLCVVLGIDLDWAVIGNTAFSGLLLAWVLIRHPPSAETDSSRRRLEPAELDEEFVRRVETLAALMREELEARRATPAG
jgi:hypothetical protein